MTSAPARLADEQVPIGGFFERHRPDGPSAGESVLAAWTQGRAHAAFVNARSAFAALAAASPEATIWLPAFLCADMAQPAIAERTRFYPVVDGFEPNLDPVVSQAASGDIILVAAWFGWPMSAAARRALQQRPDLRIVEDRAQALDAGAVLPGAWTLYSPRKLLGVADGGLLVAPARAADPPRPAARADVEALWAAPRMRADDPAGRHNSLWHAANQAKEAAMTVTHQAMTAPSLEILSTSALAPLAAARLRNWRTLDARLRAWSALPFDPATPPLGYVMRLAPETRDRLLKGLHARRIFAAVHWPRIAGPATDYPREARWTRELITLPCDHRYGDGDMARIADCVEDLLG